MTGVTTQVNFSGQAVSISGNILGTSVSGNAVNFSGQGVWISGTISISGQGVWVSGVVDVRTSGQGVWISGTHPVTTSVSGNVVDMKSGMVFNNLFDPSGAVWRNTWTPGSGSHATVVSQEEPPSYFVRATALQITSGAHMFVMFNGSGDPCIKIKAVHIWPSAEVNTVSGQVVKWDVLRITNTSGGGTALSAVVTDPRQTTSGINLTLQSRATSGCAVQSTMLSYVGSNHGLIGQGISGVASHTILYAQTAQIINILNPAGIVDFADVVVSSGFGMSIRQSTDANYTQVTSGQFDFSVKYTLG